MIYLDLCVYVAAPVPGGPSRLRRPTPRGPGFCRPPQGSACRSRATCPCGGRRVPGRLRLGRWWWDALAIPDPECPAGGGVFFVSGALRRARRRAGPPRRRRPGGPCPSERACAAPWGRFKKHVQKFVTGLVCDSMVCDSLWLVQKTSSARRPMRSASGMALQG